MNIRKQKRKEEEELNKKKERESYNRVCLIGSFILLFASFWGTARGMKQSVFTILINEPLKGLPYVMTIIILTAIIYIILRFFCYPKDK